MSYLAFNTNTASLSPAVVLDPTQTTRMDISITRPHRRVFFRDIRTEIAIESLDTFSEEEKAAVWYSDSEIESFKLRARDTCKEIKLGIPACKKKENDKNNRQSLSTIRGLEMRLSLERQRRKYMILQAIIRAQKNRDPRQLSNIARKCNVWSITLASIVGQRDYYECYNPSRLNLVAEMPPSENFPLPFKQKDSAMYSPLPTKRPISPVPPRCVRPRPATFGVS